ncbi:Eukaryotic translation initiation factor 5B [Aphelenchoides besseyi]|nr:Eukaryotic translation initiation factor 5B [Aphelenchoides besseyi]
MGSKEKEEFEDINAEDDDGAENDGPPNETAEQRKKRKKKEKKKAKKGGKEDVEESAQVDEVTPANNEPKVDPEAEGDDAADDGPPNETAEERKKRKKKEKAKAKKATGKEEKADDAGTGKKKKGGMLKELLRLRLEAEERAKQEEEERLREAEELQRRKEEEVFNERQFEEAKKRKEDMIAQQKKEGKFLTKKQRQEQERNKRIFMSQNIILPPGLQNEAASSGTGVADAQKKKRVLYGERKRDKKPAGDSKPSDESKVSGETTKPEETIKTEEPTALVDTDDTIRQETPESDVVDDWEQITETQLEPEPLAASEKPKSAVKKAQPIATSSSDESSDSEGSTDEEEDEEDDEELNLASHDDVRARLKKRREEAEAKRTTDNLRSPVICVLGHVDTGKTKMLDTIRRTNVQDGEAGGITQQIGATRIPDTAIQERCRHVREFKGEDMKIPGFLVIDTPGHESFANLRSRGSSLCDFAILVVDIMHGLEQQTIESLQLLLKRQTPFVVALNKIDRLYGYESNPRKDIWQHLRAQPQNTQAEFKQRWDSTVLQFSEQGMNIALAKDKKDPKEYISVVPTSAYHGDGIGNLMAHIVEQSQTSLAKKLAFCEELDCTVMEVRPITGLGTTIDVILVNGYLRRNDYIILSGTKGPIVRLVRDLLMPAPLKEIRVKNEYEAYKEIRGAQGVKIVAKELEHAVAGLPLYATSNIDEVKVFEEDAKRQLEQALTSIKTKPEGVYVQASTLGSLEALLEFLKTQKIPVSNVNIGPVHKKDVQKSAVMLETNPEYVHFYNYQFQLFRFACILAFDVPVDRDAQQFADREGVRVFQADIIYHLERDFLAYREELKMKRRRENEHLAIFPCRLRILPQHIFNARNPIVLGVSVEAGKLKKGTPIVAKTPDDIVFLGTVTSIEQNHDLIDMARAGDEVSIKIENTTGEAPKLYGRHFTHTDELLSRISRQSIDVCKNYFRDDLSKDDWSVVIQLKKLLKIM